VGFLWVVDMPRARIPSGTLEYVDKGRGVPLILMHGGTGSIEEWGPCVDRFSEGYRVIAFNRRGYGDSTPRETFPLDFFDEDVEDLSDLLAVLGLTEPILLCAFSDGGTLALMFAARFPDRVRAMVCAGAHIYVEEKAITGLAHAQRVFEHRIEKMGLKETPQIRSQRAWFERWLHLGSEYLSIENELWRITCPALIIQGTEDEYALISHAERIAHGIRSAELWLVEGACHWIHGGEYAGVFMERILMFFSDK
jgi:pimeloyl-ACP methyl ester carboxylesterase